MERFAYLIGNLLLLPFVLFFFWKRPDLRQKMVTMGAIASLIGLLSEIWFLKDYWRPQYTLGWPWVVEDFLFGFICGSGLAAMYQVFFGRTLGKQKYKRKDTRLVCLIAFGVVLMVLLNNTLGLNSIFASVLALLACTSVILYNRSDLILISVGTGFLTSLAAFVFYFLVLPFFPNILAHIWLLHNQPFGKTLLGIPLTELIWATSLGLASGPFYEFWQGYTIVPLKATQKVVPSQT